MEEKQGQETKGEGGVSFLTKAKSKGVYEEPFLLSSTESLPPFREGLNVYGIPLVFHYQTDRICSLISVVKMKASQLVNDTSASADFFPSMVRREIRQLVAEKGHAEFYFVIADISDLVAHVAAGQSECVLNLVLHPWLPPSMVNNNYKNKVIMGLFNEDCTGTTTTHNNRCKDCCVCVNSMREESAVVHPGMAGALVMSPENARFKVRCACEDFGSDFFCVGEEMGSPLRGNAFLNKDLPPLRGVACYYWLITNSDLANHLHGIFDKATNLTEANEAVQGLDSLPAHLKDKWIKFISLIANL